MTRRLRSRANCPPRSRSIGSGAKNERFRATVARTRSGAVSINETVLHAGVPQLPFGGVGASGYGRYHGLAGFEAFSHERVMFAQSRFSLTRLLRPPFGARADRILSWMVGAPAASKAGAPESS